MVDTVSLSNYLSKCCSADLARDDELEIFCTHCSAILIDLKPRILGINVRDQLGIIDKGPGQT